MIRSIALFNLASSLPLLLLLMLFQRSLLLLLLLRYNMLFVQCMLFLLFPFFFFFWFFAALCPSSSSSSYSSSSLFHYYSSLGSMSETLGRGVAARRTVLNVCANASAPGSTHRRWENGGLRRLREASVNACAPKGTRTTWPAARQCSSWRPPPLGCPCHAEYTPTFPESSKKRGKKKRRRRRRRRRGWCSIKAAHIATPFSLPFCLPLRLFVLVRARASLPL